MQTIILAIAVFYTIVCLLLMPSAATMVVVMSALPQFKDTRAKWHISDLNEGISIWTWMLMFPLSPFVYIAFVIELNKICIQQVHESQKAQQVNR